MAPTEKRRAQVRASVQKYRDGKRESKREMLKERSDLFVDLWKAFPVGTFRFSFTPVMDADPDLKDPIRVKLYSSEDIKPQLAAFALARGMDPEYLIDQVTEEMVDRMRKRGMVSDVDRHLVE